MTPHATNPFNTPIVPTIRERKRRVDGATLVDENGEAKPVYMRQPRYIDTEPYTKAYKDAIPWKLSLSHPALRAWVYIEGQLKPGFEVVKLSVPEALKALGWKTRQSWYAALDELELRHGIAKSTRRGFYFVNHERAFNGNRIFRNEGFPGDKPKKKE